MLKICGHRTAGAEQSGKTDPPASSPCRMTGIRVYLSMSLPALTPPFTAVPLLAPSALKICDSAAAGALADALEVGTSGMRKYWGARVCKWAWTRAEDAITEAPPAALAFAIRCVVPLPKLSIHCLYPASETTCKGCTMRFGSTAKVLLKCKLKYYRISEWDGAILDIDVLPFHQIMATHMNDGTAGQGEWQRHCS